MKTTIIHKCIKYIFDVMMHIYFNLNKIAIVTFHENVLFVKRLTNFWMIILGYNNF